MNAIAGLDVHGRVDLAAAVLIKSGLDRKSIQEDGDGADLAILRSASDSPIGCGVVRFRVQISTSKTCGAWRGSQRDSLSRARVWWSSPRTSPEDELVEHREMAASWSKGLAVKL